MEKLADMLDGPPAMEPVDFLLIDVTMGGAMGRPRVTEIPLDGTAPLPVTLEGTMLRILALEPRECHLYRIVEEGRP